MIALIEQNRRPSRATLRILRLRCGHLWPEDGMRYGKFVFSASLSCLGKQLQAYDPPGFRKTVFGALDGSIPDQFGKVGGKKKGTAQNGAVEGFGC